MKCLWTLFSRAEEELWGCRDEQGGFRGQLTLWLLAKLMSLRSSICLWWQRAPSIAVPLPGGAGVFCSCRAGLPHETPLFSFNQIVTRRHICSCSPRRFHRGGAWSRPFERAAAYAKHFSQAGLLGYQRQSLKRWPAGICI